jgi:hypothetical protein
MSSNAITSVIAKCKVAFFFRIKVQLWAKSDGKPPRQRSNGKKDGFVCNKMQTGVQFLRAGWVEDIAAPNGVWQWRARRRVAVARRDGAEAGIFLPFLWRENFECHAIFLNFAKSGAPPFLFGKSF